MGAAWDLIQLLIPVALVLVGLAFGRMNENRHYARIRQRENETRHLPVMTARTWDTDRHVAESWLAQGSVVVSIDYFKRFAAGLRNLFGGEVRSYETLLDRARREAILRMKDDATSADIIVNLRIQTSSVSGMKAKGNDTIGSIELIAYGTALRYEPEARIP